MTRGNTKTEAEMSITHMPDRYLNRIGCVLCGLVVGALAACSSPVGSSSGSAPGTRGATGSAQTGGTYQLDPAVTSLRVNADAATVDLSAQDGATAISVSEQVQGATTSKEVTGTNAVLTSRCPDGINFGNSCRVQYKVTVPVKVNVDIEGAAGDITLTGPLTNATVGTAAARITGTGLGAGTFKATTNAGQVDLTFAAAPASVQVKTDAGQVTLTVPGAEKYNVSVNTTIGTKEVAVDTDAASTHRIDVTATIGSVTIKKG
jgi:Putative adhesin